MARTPRTTLRVESLEDRTTPAYVATLAGTTATFTGDSSGATGDVIFFGQVGGLLVHNRAVADPGFSSQFDFNSGVAGDQTLAANVASVVNLTSGTGPDNVFIGGSSGVFASNARDLLATFTINNNNSAGKQVIVVDSGTTANNYTVTNAGITGTGINVSLAGTAAFDILDVRAGSAADTLTLDYNGAAITAEVLFNAGGGADTLAVTDGSFTTVTHTFDDATSGTAQITGQPEINYTGTETVADGLTATFRTFSFSEGDDTAAFADDAGGVAGLNQVTGSANPITTFGNVGALTIFLDGNDGSELDDGDDTLTLNALDAAFDGNVLVNAGGGGDDIILTATTGSGNNYNLNGQAGDDTLTLDYATLSPSGSGINFNGGAGANNDIRLLAGSATTVVHSFTGAGTGNVRIDSGTTTTYTGIATLDDRLPAGSRQFVYGNGADAITLADAAGAAAGRSQIGSASTSAAVVFANPTAALTINTDNGGTGNDTVTINPLDTTSFPISVNGGLGDDTLSLSGGVTLAGGTFDGGGGIDALNLSAATSALVVNLEAGTSSSGGFTAVENFVGGPANDTLIGRAGDATWNVLADGTGTYDNVTPTTFVSFETLVGGDGKDAFAVVPSATTAFTVGGGGPATAPGDTLSLDLSLASGAARTPTSGPNGVVSFLNRQPITFGGIEAVSPTFAVDLFAVATGAGIPTRVNVFDTDGTLRFGLQPFGEFAGGATVATGDVTGDGVDDVVVGAGAGAGPHVKVFDGATGAELQSFFAFAVGFTGGVFVGVGDVTGDGVADVVVGAGPGAGPHVKVFDGVTGAEARSFFAYAPNFAGGVSVRAGDIDGDGAADVVTGAGPGGAPHVKVFSGATGAELQSFFAGPPDDRSGVLVGVGNFDPASSRPEIVASVGGRVRVFGPPAGNVSALLPYVEQDNFVPFAAGIPAAPAAVRLGDGIIAILIGAVGRVAPRVQLIDGTSNTVRASFFAFDEAFAGGVAVG